LHPFGYFQGLKEFGDAFGRRAIGLVVKSGLPDAATANEEEQQWPKPETIHGS
jgi:hypothetical protein